jgi:hypothetical protein
MLLAVLASRLNGSHAGYGYVNAGLLRLHGARLSDRCKVTQTFHHQRCSRDTKLEYYLVLQLARPQMP